MNKNIKIMESSKIIDLLNLYHDIGVDFLPESKELKIFFNNMKKTNINSKNSLSSNRIKTISPDINTDKNEKLNKSLSKITDLTQLRDELNKFDGCLLKKTALNTVFGSGNNKAQVMLIGEAPGAEEDETGEPFVGRSGKLLVKAFESIGLSREKLFITNSVFWRPPGNRNPTEEEINTCFPFLIKIIEIISPKIIIMVGNIATTKFIPGKEPIGKKRGKWYGIDLNETTYLGKVIFHPSYLLRNPNQKKSLWLDLISIKDKIENEINI